MSEGFDVELGVSDFVAVLNQSLETAYQSVVIHGELANLRISKNRWLYFDLKDSSATVKFFGTVYQLPGPIEDGMLLSVRGQPRLHQQYGFSVNVQSILPKGEGSIRRAAQLLEAKLRREGLFDPDRKRALLYPPKSIGLITSEASAAYADFVKVLGARWGGVTIRLIDVQVQGEAAVEQLVSAVERFNSLAVPPDVLVMIRGGGSPEDLAAFSSETVTRSVATSRVPTLVAIGHEIDLSLAELAADSRASTPSNAAEILVPDRHNEHDRLKITATTLEKYAFDKLLAAKQQLQQATLSLHRHIETVVQTGRRRLQAQSQLLEALSPASVLRRGYAVVRQSGTLVRTAADLSAGTIVSVTVARGKFDASVTKVKARGK